MIVVTHSDIVRFLDCRRAWWWAFVEDRNPPDKLVGALALGQRVHRAILEGMYRDHKDPIVEHDRMIREDITTLETVDAPAWDIHRLYEDGIAGRNCVQAYVDWLADTGADSDREVDGVELEVEAPIEVRGGTVLLRGKVDVRFRMKTSGILVSDDLKTTGWDLGRTRDRLERSYQPYVYDLIQSIMNPDEMLGAAEYTVIKKVTVRQRGKPLVERFSVPGFLRSKSLVCKHVVTIVEEMVRVMAEAGTEDATRLAYYTPSDDCAWCPFKHPCTIWNESPIAGAEMLDNLYTAGRHDRYESERDTIR